MNAAPLVDRAPERFRHNPQVFVGVATASTVYVGVADRGDFDRIGVPCRDHGENENGHVLTKTVGGHGAGEVTVVFQYWLKSLTVAAILQSVGEARS